MAKLIGKSSEQQITNLAISVLIIESEAVKNLIHTINHRFVEAVDLLFRCTGKVVVTGIGKSGIVAKKISATLSSTGTPSFFLHAAEATHGDVGGLQTDDVLLAISNSGEGDELLMLAPIIKRRKIPLVSITSNPNSSLASLANVHLNASFTKEACPLGLAPTTSSTVALAMGDALALSILDARGFQAEDFAKSHPAGKLGRRLLVLVEDVMRKGDKIPVVAPSDTVGNAIIEMTKKGMGMTAIVKNEQPIGIFTDGDLRRFFQNSDSDPSKIISSVMNHSPKTISQSKLAANAAELMENQLITQLIVVDEVTNKIAGAVHMHDLMQAKVI